MSGNRLSVSKQAMPPKLPLARLFAWWTARRERWLAEALNILADGRWHPNEEFPTGALIGISIGERRGLLEVSNNGARLMPAGAGKGANTGPAVERRATSSIGDL
jgi:hypothetical protein